MKYIEKGWEGYKQLFVPKNATPDEIKRQRQAYYSGASVLFTTLILILDKGKEPTQKDLYKMRSINKELATFSEQLDKEFGF